MTSLSNKYLHWDNETQSLTELERYDEAIPIYRMAIRIARRRGLKSRLLICLHNYGECLRSGSRCSQAIRRFKDAESLASSLGDVESEISCNSLPGLGHPESGHKRACIAPFR